MKINFAKKILRKNRFFNEIHLASYATCHRGRGYGMNVRMSSIGVSTRWTSHLGMRIEFRPSTKWDEKGLFSRSNLPRRHNSEAIGPLKCAQNNRKAFNFGQWLCLCINTQPVEYRQLMGTWNTALALDSYALESVFQVLDRSKSNGLESYPRAKVILVRFLDSLRFIWFVK